MFCKSKKVKVTLLDYVAKICPPSSNNCKYVALLIDGYQDFQVYQSLSAWSDEKAYFIILSSCPFWKHDHSTTTWIPDLGLVGKEYDPRAPRRNVEGERGDLAICVKYSDLKKLALSKDFKNDLEYFLKSYCGIDIQGYVVPDHAFDLKALQMDVVGVLSCFILRNPSNTSNLICVPDDKNDRPMVKWLHGTRMERSDMSRPWVIIYIFWLGNVCIIVLIFAMLNGTALIHPQILGEYEISQEITFTKFLTAISRFFNKCLAKRQEYSYRVNLKRKPKEELEAKVSILKDQSSQLELLLAKDPTNEQFRKLKSDCATVLSVTNDLLVAHKLQNECFEDVSLEIGVLEDSFGI